MLRIVKLSVYGVRERNSFGFVLAGVTVYAPLANADERHNRFHRNVNPNSFFRKSFTYATQSDF